MTTQSTWDSTTYCRKTNMWSHVHKGNCRLQPLLGEFKPVTSMDNVTKKMAVPITDRVVSLRVTPQVSGPADVEFLKNRMGFCLPSVDLILRSQRLRTICVDYSDCPLSQRSSNAKSSRDENSSSSSDNTNSNTGNKKTSVTMESLAKSKRMQKKSSEKDEEAMTTLRLLVNNEETDLRDVDRLEHILNIKVSNSGSFCGVSAVGHTERRMSQLRKIANKARKSSMTHELWLDRKLSTFRERDEKLTINVRTHLDTSKIDERIKAINKISQIEETRKRIKSRTEGLSMERLSGSDEELDETYHIISRNLNTRSDMSYDFSARSSTARPGNKFLDV